MYEESIPKIPSLEALLSGEDLKQKLLGGTLNANEFLDGLFKLDQSTDERSDAIQNVEILTSPEIVDFFNNCEDQDRYHFILSLSYFHKGQIQARAVDYMEARESFKKSLDTAVLISSTDNQPWKDYVAGTVAYFEKDLPKLKIIHNGMQEEGRNKFILESFINQLEADKGIDYEAALIAAKR